MAFKVIYSRTFLEKVTSWPSQLQTMAFEAAEHAAINPTLNDYVRPAIVPYKQKHPTTDRQYTLYFEILPSANEIFVVWINDDSCLHDTRANFPDPCQKEFEKLRSRNQLEKFDPKYHRIVFEVHPNSSKPINCRSSFLGGEITLNTYLDSAQSIFIGHAFYCDERCEEIAKRHVSGFFAELDKLLTTAKHSFQFQFTKLGHAHETNLLINAHNSSRWAVIDDSEDFILRKN